MVFYFIVHKHVILTNLIFFLDSYICFAISQLLNVIQYNILLIHTKNMCYN